MSLLVHKLVRHSGVVLEGQLSHVGLVEGAILEYSVLNIIYTKVHLRHKVLTPPLESMREPTERS